MTLRAYKATMVSIWFVLLGGVIATLGDYLDYWNLSEVPHLQFFSILLALTAAHRVAQLLGLVWSANLAGLGVSNRVELDDERLEVVKLEGGARILTLFFEEAARTWTPAVVLKLFGEPAGLIAFSVCSLIWIVAHLQRKEDGGYSLREILSSGAVRLPALPLELFTFVVWGPAMVTWAHIAWNSTCSLVDVLREQPPYRVKKNAYGILLGLIVCSGGLLYWGSDLHPLLFGGAVTVLLWSVSRALLIPTGAFRAIFTMAPIVFIKSFHSGELGSLLGTLVLKMSIVAVFAISGLHGDSIPLWFSLSLGLFIETVMVVTIVRLIQGFEGTEKLAFLLSAPSIAILFSVAVKDQPYGPLLYLTLSSLLFIGGNASYLISWLVGFVPISLVSWHLYSSVGIVGILVPLATYAALEVGLPPLLVVQWQRDYEVATRQAP